MKLFIHKRLFLTLSIAGFIPLSILGYFIYGVYTEKFKEESEKHAISIVREKGFYIASIVQREYRAMQNVADKLSDNRSENKFDIERYRHASSFINYIAIVNYDSSIDEIYFEKEHDKKLLKKSTWSGGDLSEVFEGKDKIISPHFDPITGKGALTMVFPIYASWSAVTVLHALVVSYDWELFAEYLAGGSVGGHHSDFKNHFMVIKEDGTAIFCDSGEKIFSSNLVSIGMSSAQLSLQRAEGFMYEKFTEHGQSAYAAYTWIRQLKDMPSYNWGILYYQDVEKIEEPLKFFKWWASIIFIAIFIGMIIASYYFAKMITDPLLKLSNHFNIKNKDQFLPILENEHKFNDEISELYSSYNNLVLRYEDEKKHNEIASHELMKSTKMAEIGNLASTIVHEVNNPLAIILLHLEKLRDRHKNELSVEVKSGLNTIFVATKRIKKTVSSLLSYSRQSEKPEELDLHKIIKESADIIGLKLAKSNISLKLELNAELSTFTINTLEIQQMFMNFLSNANDSIIEAKRENGEILIRTHNGDDTLIIEIEDNGTGISEENVEKMFATHFTTKAHGKGTGLGMFQIAQSIKKLSGDIVVGSVLGSGSRFTITLPNPMGSILTRSSAYIPKRPEELFDIVSEKQAMKVAPGKLSVLIVDDEEVFIKILKTYLEDFNAVVDGATTANEAIDLVSNAKYSLVISDMNMPGMSGRDLSKKLKEGGFTGKFVLISGNIEDDVPSFLKKNPTIDGVLSKPFEIEQIREIFDQISKERQLQGQVAE